MKTAKLWDIFCRVVDNYGDIGVCWRLASDLAGRGESVRLWVDDANALRWMAPAGSPGVEVKPWPHELPPGSFSIGDVLIEAFGCEIPPSFVTAYARKTAAGDRKGVWINLEYLSAQGFVERSHALPSPVMIRPGAGLTKYFYYPGFTPATGGLLREPDLAARRAGFKRCAWLAQLGLAFQGERLVSLFCYEPPALGELLERLSSDPQTTRLLVTAGRATAAVKACVEIKSDRQPAWNRHGRLQISYLPALSQRDFDHLLWACDLNFVRGEDSLVRALWANKPLVWQIYPQTDEAHHPKLDAFVNLLQASPSLRAFHAAWNGIGRAALPALELPQWQQTVTQARQRLLEQDDLVTKLRRFVLENR